MSGIPLVKVGEGDLDVCFCSVPNNRREGGPDHSVSGWDTFNARIVNTAKAFGFDTGSVKSKDPEDEDEANAAVDWLNANTDAAYKWVVEFDALYLRRRLS